MKHTTKIAFSIILMILVIPALALAGSATLHWQANTEPDLAGYRIYYGTSSRSYGPYISVDKNTTSYTINNLTEGQTYYFALTAVDTSGNESGYSQEVSKVISSSSSASDSSILVLQYLTHIYQEVLGRDPDQSGLEWWANHILTGRMSAKEVAEGFISSDEFRGRNVTNSEFVNILYRAFLEREPDSSGYNFWLAQLENGKGRQNLLNDFLASHEFAIVCHKYRIRPYRPGENIAAQVLAFITHLYAECLGRNPDQPGLSWWTQLLLSRSMTAGEVARGFVFSEEFKRRNTTDEQFVSILYKALLGREPDSSGYNFWLNKIRSGWSRKQVLDGFLRSSEFASVCQSYDLSP